MTTIVQQAPCGCCETYLETKGGCAGPGPGIASLAWVECLVSECACLTPYTEELCEDCYLMEK
jgi:hypothetical protein